MSLRIQNDPTADLGASSSVRARKTNSTGNSGVFFQSSIKNSGPDKVDISPVTESLRSTLNEQSLTQAQRVKQLTALYASGKYTVDAAQVSKSLISAASGAIAGEI